MNALQKASITAVSFMLAVVFIFFGCIFLFFAQEKHRRLHRVNSEHADCEISSQAAQVVMV